MTNKMQTGVGGEDIAAEYLETKGYEIMERNFRYGKAEIDLIVKKKNWLVFVEVKTRASSAFGFPEEFVDRAQELNILYAAEYYQYKVNWEGNVRYDIISVLGVEWEREVMHFEDAFY